VLAVGTHKDMVGSEEELALVGELFRDRFEHTKFWLYLAVNTDGNRKFFPVDSKTRDARGVANDPTVQQLRTKVEQLAIAQDYIHMKVPFRWLLVLDRLQTLSKCQKGENMEGKAGRQVRRLSLQAVHNIASECGLPSAGSHLEEEVGALLHLFHELGMLVHYDEPALRDIVILDPQWLIDLIARIIRVYKDGLHKLDVDEIAKLQLPGQWRMLVEEGKLSRQLLDLLWEGLTESATERDTLLHLLQKFDLLLLWRGLSNGSTQAAPRNNIYMVPSMLPEEAAVDSTDRAVEGMPEFYLVFCKEPQKDIGESEISSEETNRKGFMPEGLFPRLLKRAANWYQHTGISATKGGRQPVLFKNYAELSFGPVDFALELQKNKQMIRVQLLVKNPTLVVERIQEMVEEIKKKCMPQLEYFIAVKVPEAGDILISLDRVHKTIGEGAQVLWVGKGRQQCKLGHQCFELWCPPAIETFYDVFISYRQTSDTVFARMLYDCLSKFAFGTDGRRLKVFLDRERLLSGLSWKEGFVEGLRRSTLMAPIVSKGCLEPMAKLDPAAKDWCDNVLLEWKLGLELIHQEEYPLQAILPIMVGTEDVQSGKMGDFFEERKGVQLSSAPSTSTHDELLRWLPTAKNTTGLSVEETLNRLLELQGVKAWEPTSTHGRAMDVSVEDWKICEGCANQIYRVLCEQGKLCAVDRNVDAAGAGRVDAHVATRPIRAKKGFRASAVSTSAAVLLEGSLMKRSTGVLKRWQQRYFVVAGHYLKYADSEDAVLASPKATVDLNALKSCTITRGVFLMLTFEDSMALELQTATAEEAQGWHDVLAGCMPSSDARKASMIQSLDHYAPRKGTLVFERKGGSSFGLDSGAAVDAQALPTELQRQSSLLFERESEGASSASALSSPQAKSKQPSSPARIATLTEWLADHRLQVAEDGLREYGAEVVEDLAELDDVEEMLHSLKLKPLKAKQLRKAIAQLKQ
jgi:hypothetical protein